MRDRFSARRPRRPQSPAVSECLRWGAFAAFVVPVALVLTGGSTRTALISGATTAGLTAVIFVLACLTRLNLPYLDRKGIPPEPEPEPAYDPPYGLPPYEFEPYEPVPRQMSTYDERALDAWPYRESETPDWDRFAPHNGDSHVEPPPLINGGRGQHRRSGRQAP